MSTLIDMTGKKIGRLTVIRREGTYQRPSGNKEPTWRCVCECGKEVVVHASNLKKRNTLSCGCLQGESRKEPHRETEYEVRGEDACVKAFDGAEVLVNSCDLDYVLSHRWHLNGHGYAVDEHGITMHRALMFPPDCMDIHHINGNKLDNRRSNLLMLTRSEHTALHNGKNLANGVVVREKGEWGLEARSFYRDTFDESCELVVYILANCTNCGEKHPNAHQVFSKTLYAPEDAEEDFRFNQSLERMNALREFKAKGYKFAHFCPNCGADMTGGDLRV